MGFELLAQAVNRNLEYLNRLDPEYLFNYGTDEITCKQVKESYELFLQIISKNPDPEELSKKIRKFFNIYRAAGRIGNNKTLFTGYFEPTFEGSLSPDGEYRYPLYKKPDDLIRIDLSSFDSKYKGQSIIARIDGNEVVPYYTRKQIEKDKVLRGRGLEIAWLKDPVDVAFLQIQGSGRIRLRNEEMMSVGYHASNGMRYKSIGRYMINRGFLKSEDVSMQGIREYLSIHPEIIDEVLNYNPSYVFFRRREKGPHGNINVILTPGRSIALNLALFPKGSLCFISCVKPVVDSKGKIEKWTDFSRFVLNQDTGGAITGAGRADIYWGNDDYAELAAGNLKHEGELYVLAPKIY
ncbi:MAG: murein transglycosylase A [Deltaproteobacteria bacterium]|nr:murein transglycosylase A [Deltaproteobacteria bacterium]